MTGHKLEQRVVDNKIVSKFVLRVNLIGINLLLIDHNTFVTFYCGFLPKFSASF